MDVVAEILDRVDVDEKVLDIGPQINWASLSSTDVETLLREASKRQLAPGGYELLKMLYQYKSNDDYWVKARIIATMLQREKIPIETRWSILKTLEITLAQIKKKYLDDSKQTQSGDLRRFQMLEAAYYAFNGKMCADEKEISKARQKYHEALTRYQELGVVNGVFAIRAQLKQLDELVENDAFPATTQTPERNIQTAELANYQGLVKAAKEEYERLLGDVKKLQSAREQISADINTCRNEYDGLEQSIARMKSELNANVMRANQEHEKSIADLRAQLLAKERTQQEVLQQIAERESAIEQLKAQLQQQREEFGHQAQQSLEPDAKELTRLAGAIKQAKDDLDYYQKQIATKQKDLRELNEKISSASTPKSPVINSQNRRDGLRGDLPGWLE